MDTTTEQLKKACAKALQYSTLIRWDDSNGPHACVTSDLDLAFALKRIEHVVALIVRESGEVTIDRGDGAVLSPLGKQLLATIRGCPYGLFEDFFPHHALHPLIGLFWRHTKDFLSSKVPKGNPRIERLKLCVSQMRAESRGKEFRKARELHVKLVKDNTRSLLSYIDALFCRYSKLLIVRVDLSYSAEVSRCWPAEGTVKQEEAVEHRKQLLRYLRISCPAKLRGYAWSFEHSPSKSYHYHWLLFFDGHTSREGVTLARVIGEHWKAIITKGYGLYYNCNAHAKDYFADGTGLIHYSNSRAVEALKQLVAPYLTKGAYWARFAIPHGRTFGHGGCPKADRRGRLRRPKEGASGDG